jgi:hypothetical protein
MKTILVPEHIINDFNNHLNSYVNPLAGFSKSDILFGVRMEIIPTQYKTVGQKRKNRKSRTNKKWLKKYGLKVVTVDEISVVEIPFESWLLNSPVPVGYTSEKLDLRESFYDTNRFAFFDKSKHIL